MKKLAAAKLDFISIQSMTFCSAAGSQAEMCQLRVGDEVLTVNRHQVAEMSYLDWKACMEEALQDGSLVMDVRRHGQNSESSRWAGSGVSVGRLTSSRFAF